MIQKHYLQQTRKVYKKGKLDRNFCDKHILIKVLT